MFRGCCPVADVVQMVLHDDKASVWVYPDQTFTYRNAGSRLPILLPLDRINIIIENMFPTDLPGGIKGHINACIPTDFPLCRRTYSPLPQYIVSNILKKALATIFWTH